MGALYLSASFAECGRGIEPGSAAKHPASGEFDGAVKHRSMVMGITRHLHRLSVGVAVLLQLTLAAAQALPEGNTGIAAKYPGDSGIASDPSVIFAEDFESYSS